MDQAQQHALRDRTAHLALDWHRETEGDFTGEDAVSYRPVIEAAHVVADEARAALGRWVTAGRRAGLSWAEIGAAVGVSKQAAQQRFGTAEPDEVPGDDLIVRSGATAFNEMTIAAEEGRAGRELVATRALKLFFRQTDQIWEYLRTVGEIEPRRQHAEGWRPVSSWFPFHYYKRPA